uniref:Uncharacterized protein n=1 Tax=Schizaphis graminum TaxID=13262 RepID=A0A2S2PA44_SCHGA
MADGHPFVVRQPTDVRPLRPRWPFAAVHYGDRTVGTAVGQLTPAPRTVVPERKQQTPCPAALQLTTYNIVIVICYYTVTVSSPTAFESLHFATRSFVSRISRYRPFPFVRCLSSTSFVTFRATQ